MCKIDFAPPKYGKQRVGNKDWQKWLFMAGAPLQVAETERKKQADAEAKIKALEEALKNLGI